MKALCLVLLAFVFAPRSLAGDDTIPFAEMGKTFLKTRCKVDDPAAMPIDTLRNKFCVHGAIGYFDVAFPVWSLEDKDHVEEFKTIAGLMVQIQLHWMDWLAKGKPELAAPKADAETLLAWIKTWKPASFALAARADDKDLYAVLDASPAQRDASRRLDAFIRDTKVLGVAPRTSDVEPMHILFAPTRRDYVDFMAYTGLQEPARQPELWTMDATAWTNFWSGWTIVLALQYPPWSFDKEFKQFVPMNKYEPTGMQQHTVQHTMLTFLWMVYGDNDALHLNQAAAMNMAIEICGEINALEGNAGRGTTGARTEPYEKFVPGGNPNGGLLPPISAAPYDSEKKCPWHENLGRDHFALPLRKGQKAGGKQAAKEPQPKLDPVLARDKNAHFQLTSKDENKKWVVTAPFFGEAARTKQYPPNEFIVDYREFFRAYKCGFAYWLQTQGDAKGAEASAAKHREFLAALAKRDSDRKLEEVVLAVYGIPLSGKNGSVDSLEWRYLEWLAKGK